MNDARPLPHRWTAQLGLLLVIAAPAWRAARAQTPGGSPGALDRPVHLAGRLSLADALRQVGDQAGVSAVADGAPLRASADVELRASARQALDRLGEVFDYWWSPGPGGIVLMRKRFHDPNERPQMHVPELKQWAEELVRVLRSIPYEADDRSWELMLRQLASTFTPEQFAVLKRKERLHASALTADQRRLIQLALATRAFAHPAAAGERLLAQMKAIHASRMIAEEVPTPSGGSGVRRLLVKHVAGQDASAVVAVLGEIDARLPQGGPR